MNQNDSDSAAGYKKRWLRMDMAAAAAADSLGGSVAESRRL